MFKYLGRQVQMAHMELAKSKIQWPSFELPTRSTLSIADVLLEEEKNRNEMLMIWAKNVWETWEHQHNWTRNICESFN